MDDFSTDNFDARFPSAFTVDGLPWNLMEAFDLHDELLDPPELDLQALSLERSYREAQRFEEQEVGR